MRVNVELSFLAFCPKVGFFKSNVCFFFFHFPAFVFYIRTFSFLYFSLLDSVTGCRVRLAVFSLTRRRRPRQGGYAWGRFSWCHPTKSRSDQLQCDTELYARLPFAVFDRFVMFKEVCGQGHFYKRNIIRCMLHSRLRSFCCACISSGPVFLSSDQYNLLGVDIREKDQLEAALGEVGFDWTAPTMILSEVVLTYMETHQ